MSLIFQYNQYNGKLNRLVYFPNNRAELIHSHGLTTLEGMLYHHKQYKGTPFEHLPKAYNHFCRDDQKLLYEITKDELESEKK